MNRFITWWSDSRDNPNHGLNLRSDAVRCDELTALVKLYDEKLARSTALIDYWIKQSEDSTQAINELIEENTMLKASNVDENSIFNDALDNLKNEISASVGEFNKVVNLNVDKIFLQYAIEEAVGLDQENILVGVNVYDYSTTGISYKLDRK